MTGLSTVTQESVHFRRSDKKMFKENLVDCDRVDLCGKLSEPTLSLSPISVYRDETDLGASVANFTNSYRLTQEIFSCWIAFVSSFLNIRVERSLRVPESNVSLNKFWEELYKRERQLTVAPGFYSSSFDLFKSVSENMSWHKDYCEDISGCDGRDQTLRCLVIYWLRAVVNKMAWKESTFFIAIHILDSYVSSFEYKQKSAININKMLKSSNFFHNCVLEFLPSSPPGFNWWLTATAALYLAVAVEEEHTQILRARKILMGPFLSILTQVNTTKISILSRLTSGFLITRTPEDFLYYFLANMKSSSKFFFMYERLLNPQLKNICERICRPSACTLDFFNSEKYSCSEKSENYFYFSPWIVPFENLDVCMSCCLSTLPGVVRFVLLSTCLAFMDGLYCVIPSSRLTAVCLFLGLVSESCPELSSSFEMVDTFCKEIFYFYDAHELLYNISICLPLLERAASDMLKKKICRTVSLHGNTCFQFLSTFVKQLILIVKHFSHKMKFQFIPKPSFTDSVSQCSVAETVTTTASNFRHSLQDSPLSFHSQLGSLPDYSVVNFFSPQATGVLSECFSSEDYTMHSRHKSS